MALKNSSISPELGRARFRDANDPLACFRDQFYIPPNTIYLDGNSLGLLSKPAEASVLRLLNEWSTLGVGGWLEGKTAWFTLAETVAEEIAPLLGARPDEIAIANSTTVNLHQLLSTLFKPDARRHAILADSFNFPSDLYAIQSHLRLRGLDVGRCLHFVPSRNEHTLDEEDIILSMTEDVAVAVFPVVLYASGQLLDVQRIACEARRRGIVIGLDCSHSVGAVPHALDEWDVDFAFWCNYKYLNGGPGSIGGLYLNRRHFGASPGMAGWFGNRKSTQFDMCPTFDPAPDAQRLHIGTPDILSLAALQGSLQVVSAAGIDGIRRKSIALTEYLMVLADVQLAPLGVKIATPREEERRGGHIALSHPDATRICKALRAAGVIPDFRPPNIVRLAPIALYTSFQDCYEAVKSLRTILETGEHLKYEAGRGLVA